jgi:hypothetical protein
MGVYISSIWVTAPSQPVLTFYDAFGGLADAIKYTKVCNDRSRGFAGPENRMFLWESRIVHNTALARENMKIKALDFKINFRLRSVLRMLMLLLAQQLRSLSIEAVFQVVTWNYFISLPVSSNN